MNESFLVTTTESGGNDYEVKKTEMSDWVTLFCIFIYKISIMKKTIRLTESDLIKLVKRIINEKIEFGKHYEDVSDDIEPGDAVDFKKYGPLYVISIMGDGYLVSDDSEQRYMGDDGDGYIIPLSSGKRALILDKGESDEEDDDDYDFSHL